ncbi:hypothetical protein HPB47_016685, partial [Ixodes persulcatus]
RRSINNAVSTDARKACDSMGRMVRRYRNVQDRPRLFGYGRRQKNCNSTEIAWNGGSTNLLQTARTSSLRASSRSWYSCKFLRMLPRHSAFPRRPFEQPTMSR